MKGVLFILSSLVLLAAVHADLVDTGGDFRPPTTAPPKTDDVDRLNGFDKDGKHVCNWMDTVTKRIEVKTWEDYVTTEIIKTCCGWGPCFRPTCNKTKTAVKQRPVSRWVTRHVDRKTYHCCSGWQREKPKDTECLEPVCQPECQNGGTCTLDHKCKCTDKFSGKFCQNTVDKCKTSANNCEQSCIATPGGFHCACNLGYSLNADGRTCRDNDECSTDSPPCTCDKQDGVCKATCKNTPGSFQCLCDNGYTLGAGRKCIDRDECIEDSTRCDQKCVNTPGSFRCECISGFYYNKSSKKCEDVNECEKNNGGCSDKCHNVKGSYLCSCPDRFYLGKDRHTCQALNTSMNSLTICENDMEVVACTYPKKIALIDAFYGRLVDTVCQHGDYTSNLRCSADNPYDKVKSCTNKISCVLMSMNAIFGDPCPNVSKYLQVVYDCL